MRPIDLAHALVLAWPSGNSPVGNDHLLKVWDYTSTGWLSALFREQLMTSDGRHAFLTPKGEALRDARLSTMSELRS